MSPRWFHKINVAIVRTVNAPLLLLISALERHSLWNEYSPKKATTNRGDAVKFKKPSKLAFWGFSRFSVHGDIQAVFDTEPPSTIPEEIDEAPQQGSRDVARTDRVLQEDGRDDQTASPVQTRKDSRKDLELPSKGGLSPKQLRQMMEEAVDGGDMSRRLEELELSTKRVEALLVKLVDSLGNPVTEETE